MTIVGDIAYAYLASDATVTNELRWEDPAGPVYNGALPVVVEPTAAIRITGVRA